MIFAASGPMTVRELARATQSNKKTITEVLLELSDEYATRGIQLREGPHGWSFLTSPRFSKVVRNVTGKKPIRMTRAQLETLAIIAYRQPVTRPEIDDVRGVDSGPVLRTLLDRDMIRVLGKKEEPGRPILYGTTDAFLELLSLKSLGDLPTLREFTELSETSRETYERRLGEAAPAGAIVFDDDPDEVIDPTKPLDDPEAEAAAMKEPEPDVEDGDEGEDEDEDGNEDDDDELDDDELDDDDSLDDDSLDDDDGVDDDELDDDELDDELEEA